LRLAVFTFFFLLFDVECNRLECVGLVGLGLGLRAGLLFFVVKVLGLLGLLGLLLFGVASTGVFLRFE